MNAFRGIRVEQGLIVSTSLAPISVSVRPERREIHCMPANHESRTGRVRVDVPSLKPALVD